MCPEKKIKQQDPLQQMLEEVDKNILIDLIGNLALMSPEVHCECFDYLKKHIKLSPGQQEISDGEVVFVLWGELEPDLAELDEYGGNDYSLSVHVGELLSQIQEKLEKNIVPAEYRADLLDEVLPYIQSANTNLDDSLYDVAYSCCYETDDFRLLAEAFEVMGRDWPIDHARRIYRKIGDKEKYLELRAVKMEYGSDYHDLATFYWQNGEKDKASKVAQDGLKKGKGRLDELRQFLSDRAQETGDRKKYLQLQFDQTVDRLTLKKYQAFKKLCTKDEWGSYEDAVLKKIAKAWQSEKLKIHMDRKDYDKALATLLKAKYPYDSYGGEYELKAAANLEKRFPEKILGYYLSGLGNLNCSLTRKEYAGKARIMIKVRHLYVDIMNTPDKWTNFGRQVKVENRRRPAFQQEFEKVVPGWNAL